MKFRLSTLLIILLCSVATILLSNASSSSFKIVFCNVGQGSAALLQMRTTQILFDTGPDGKILSCVGKHMPFFDKEIDMVIISHQQKDHAGGLTYLSRKYSIKKIYNSIEKRLLLHVGYVTVDVFKASQSSSDINELALVATIKSPHHTIFLPSDINGIELKGLLPKDTTILAAPHHGSKYGLYPDSLDLAKPLLTVISVGKKNSYGHPSKEVLDILKAKKIKVWRTDEQGELVIDL